MRLILRTERQKQKRLNELKELSNSASVQTLFEEIERGLKEQKKAHTEAVIRSKELDGLLRRKEKSKWADFPPLS